MNILQACLITVAVLGIVDLAYASFKSEDRVLYKDLGTLYFSVGQWTRARRTRSVPQLVCLKGCHYPQPKIVECTNTGWDGNSNLWRCKAELDPSYALDNAEVVCEGYNSPDDAFVTAGSCSLEYSIKPKSKRAKVVDDSSGGVGIFFVIFCAFLIFVLYKTCLKPDEEQIRQNSSTNDDRPDDGHGPRMGWNIPGMNRRSNYRGSPGFGFSPPTGDSCGNQGNAGLGGGIGGGGFWTGLATGGILGSLFSGNRNSNTGYAHRPSTSSEGYSGRSGGLFSSGYDYTADHGSSSRSSGGPFDDSSTSESVTTARYRQR